jgi:zona occludens toxin (predicted ATPase)
VPTRRLLAMPLRAYFLVITPALAAFLWWASWYLQPEPPKVYRTASAPAATTRAGKPASATTGTAPAAATTGAAPVQAAAAAAEPQAADVKLVASTSVEDSKPVVQAPKHKKRKTARRKPRDVQTPAYAYGGAAGNPYGGQYGSQGYYAGYQPFFGYGRQ